MEVLIEGRQREWDLAARMLAWALSYMPVAVARGIGLSLGSKSGKAMMGGEYRDLLKYVPGHREEFD